jgi:arylsulfatase A-like enzyme
VEQSNALALRQGNWKYIEPSNGPGMNVLTNTETGQDPSGQLFNLDADPGEAHNLIKSSVERAEGMAALLNQIRNAGRSRPANPVKQRTGETHGTK